jgi:hypothetical protein
MNFHLLRVLLLDFKLYAAGGELALLRLALPTGPAVIQTNRGEHHYIDGNFAGILTSIVQRLSFRSAGTC